MQMTLDVHYDFARRLPENRQTPIGDKYEEVADTAVPGDICSESIAI